MESCCVIIIEAYLLLHFQNNKKFKQNKMHCLEFFPAIEHPNFWNGHIEALFFHNEAAKALNVGQN